MTKQILDIKLAGIDPNRPGSKRVAEAVGVHLAHPSPHPVTGEHDVHVVIAKRPAVKGLEEAAFAPAPEVLQAFELPSRARLPIPRAHTFDAGSPAHRFYALLAESAETSIRNQMMRDEELFE